MIGKNDSKNSLVIGVAILVMGLLWLVTTVNGQIGTIDLSNWWAFGILIPIGYALMSMFEGGIFVPRFGSIVITVAGIGMLLAFLGLFPFTTVAPISFVAVGLGFIAATFGTSGQTFN